MELLIEKAKLEDAISLAELKIDIWQKVYKNILPDEYLKNLTASDKIQKYKDELKENSSIDIYFLKSHNSIIGTLRIKYYLNEEKLKCISIEDLYLMPQYHNKGYGGLAIDFAYKKAIATNCNMLTAWVVETNILVRKMAVKMGFFETKNIRVHASTGIKLIQYCYILET